MKFFNFIFNPLNRKILLILFVYHILIALILHWAYPFTICTNDTPNYFFAAEAHEFCGYRPYGYSAFINFCVLFSKSLYCIVFIQSLLYFVATLLFIFTIEYLIPFKNKKLFYLFIVLFSLSGQAFLISNTLLSDSLFMSFSLIWISSLLHLFTNKKNRYILVILNLIVCFCLAKIRYAGLVYPVVGSLAALVIYRKNLKNLFIYVAGFMLIIWTVYEQGISQNEVNYGVRVFSAFGGWAKLNNASVVVPEIKKGTREDEIALQKAFKPSTNEDLIKKDEIYLFDRFLKKYPDSIYSTKNVLSSQLMWDKKYPEKFYFSFLLKKYQKNGYVPCYAYCGKLYGEYADYLIKTHLVSFISKFYFPNFFRAVYPKDEGLGKMHMRVDESIKKVCDVDFAFFAARNDIYGAIISFFDEIKYLILFITFLFSLVYYIVHKYFKRIRSNGKIVFLFISFFLILNSLFLAYSIPIFLRFLVINEALLITAIFVFLDEFYKLRHRK